MSESNSQKSVRRTRGDQRDEEGQLVSYQDETGSELAWTGDEEAPYVKVVNASTDPVPVTIENTVVPVQVLEQPVQIEGDVAVGLLDDPATSNPVKIGGTAVDTTVALQDTVTPVLEDTRANALFDTFGVLGTTPWPTKVPWTDPNVLWATFDGLSTSDFETTPIVDVTHYRSLTLYCIYVAGDAGGFPQMIPLGSTLSVEPAVADTYEWYPFEADSGAVTAVTLTDTLPAEIQATAAPGWGAVTMYSLVIQFPPSTAGNDIVTMKIRLDVTDINWFRLLVVEAGTVGQEGSLFLRYSLAD